MTRLEKSLVFGFTTERKEREGCVVWDLHEYYGYIENHWFTEIHWFTGHLIKGFKIRT